MNGYGKYIRYDQDVLKTSSEDEDERRLLDIFIKTNVSWEQTPNEYVSLKSFAFYQTIVKPIYHAFKFLWS